MQRKKDTLCKIKHRILKLTRKISMSLIFNCCHEQTDNNMVKAVFNIFTVKVYYRPRH